MRNLARIETFCSKTITTFYKVGWIIYEELVTSNLYKEKLTPE